MKSFEDILKQKINDIEFPYEEGKWEEFKNYYRKNLFIKKYFLPSMISLSSILLIITIFFILNNNYEHKKITNNLNTTKFLVQNYDNSIKSNDYSSYNIGQNKNISSIDISNNKKESITKTNIVKNNNNNTQENLTQSPVVQSNNTNNENKELVISSAFKLSQYKGCTPLYIMANPERIYDEYEYVWDFGDETIVNSVTADHTYFKEGTYNVTLKILKDKKIISHTSVPVVVHEKPDASFNYFEKNNSVKFITTAKKKDIVNKCIYTFNSQTKEGKEVVFNYNKSGKYEVTQIVIDNNGCVDTNSKTISLAYNLPIFIPTAFSPNNDNVNDLFIPIVYDSASYFFTMQIFDKVGKKIYEEYGKEVKWNGINEKTGAAYPQDFYNYIIVVSDNRGNKNEFKGKVRLLNE